MLVPSQSWCFSRFFLDLLSQLSIQQKICCSSPPPLCSNPSNSSCTSTNIHLCSPPLRIHSNNCHTSPPRALFSHPLHFYVLSACFFTTTINFSTYLVDMRKIFFYSHVEYKNIISCLAKFSLFFIHWTMFEPEPNISDLNILFMFMFACCLNQTKPRPV